MSATAVGAPPEAPVVRWEAGQAPDAISWRPGKAFTLIAEVPSLAGDEFVSLMQRRGGVAIRLATQSVSDQRAIVCELAIEGRPAPLRLSAPVDTLGLGRSHKLAMRYLGYRAELWVDGVLVDEDWPAGDVPVIEQVVPGRSLRSLMIWSRVFSADDLIARCGSHQALDMREMDYLGAPLPVGQYWRPRGINTFVGDCMPFFHDGRFHLFYLLDRHHHGSKWGKGAHQWAHISTTDLRHWDEHPLAVPITDEQEGSICTGSLFFHDGVYHAFYAVRTMDGSAAPLYDATSTDGVKFEKHPPLATLTAPYQGPPARDPVVFRAGDKFHMLVTSELLNHSIPGRGGCLAQLTSTDLKQWKQEPPFLVPGYPGQPECADYFRWGQWYYLVFSTGGIAHYRLSREPLGPWQTPAVDTFDGPMARVMKTAEFTGSRRIGAAFIPADVGGGQYAGQVVFRELIQNEDGTLSTKWPAEMRPELGNEVEIARAIRLDAHQSLEAAKLADAPSNFHLKATIAAESTGTFAIRFGAKENMEGGAELRFDPVRQLVSLVGPGGGEHAALYHVEGLDKPFDVELLVKGNLTDVCVNDRRTLIARLPGTAGKSVFALAHNSVAKVTDAHLRAVGTTGASTHRSP